MNKKVIITSMVLALIGQAFSQDLLSPDQAVELALKHNFIIHAEQNKAEVARISNSAGNAGMLPKAFAEASGTKNDTVTSINPSVTVTWTLFDGMKMFAEKSRLKRLEQIGEINFKDTLQTVVAQTLTAYYDIVSSVQQLAGISKAIAVSEERVTIAKKQFQVGTVSKVDFLQASLDMNEQKAGALSQQDIITRKKISLNLLLGRLPETDFTTTDTIPVTDALQSLTWDELQERNFELSTAAMNVDVARLNRKEAFSQFLPSLDFSANYGANYSKFGSGLFVQNRNYGLGAGLLLTVPLFNGFNTVRSLSIADLNILNSQIALDNARLQIRAQYYQARKDFEKAEESLKLEETNIGLANENLKIALERFRLAESTALEMRTAEQSYMDAVTRLVNARFNAKAAETELLRIQGELVK